jgi:integrase
MKRKSVTPGAAILTPITTGQQDKGGATAQTPDSHKSKAILLEPASVVDAMEAHKLLNGEVTLTYAATFYIKHRPAASPDTSLEAVIVEFLETQKRNNGDQRHIERLEHHLKHFVRETRCPISLLSVRDVNQFLANLTPARTRRRAYWRSIRTLLNFAKSRGYLPSDYPMILIDRAPEQRAPLPWVFDPFGLRRLLTSAPDDLVVPIALGAFAGLRIAEILNLDANDINLELGYIHLKNRRPVGIPANLKAWLLKYLPKVGPVCPSEDAFRRIWALARKVDLSFTENCLRQSYIAYRFAETEQPQKVAAEVGSTVRVVFKHVAYSACSYGAKDWFSILPQDCEHLRDLGFSSNAQ